MDAAVASTSVPSFPNYAASWLDSVEVLIIQEYLLVKIIPL